MTPGQHRAHRILQGQTLLDAWQARARLWAESDRLWAESDRLRAEGSKLWAEGSRLRAESSKLWAESDRLWADAIEDEFGPGCTITWEGDTCTLGCGEIYRPEGVKS